LPIRQPQQYIRHSNASAFYDRLSKTLFRIHLNVLLPIHVGEIRGNFKTPQSVESINPTFYRLLHCDDFTMNRILYATLFFAFASCTQGSSDTVISEAQKAEDELEARKAQATLEAEVLEKEQSERFKTYIGLIKRDSASMSDTLITFWHDYSFAGRLAGKVCQILRSENGVSITEVFYSNRPEHTPEDSGFTSMCFRTGMTGFTAYKYDFYRQELDITQWNRLVKSFQSEDYFSLPPFGNQAVIDGTSTSLTFESHAKNHSVYRRWLDEDAFYRLCKMIDSFTKNELENFYVH